MNFFNLPGTGKLKKFSDKGKIDVDVAVTT